MKIEAGIFYKTRDGRKVRIYAIDGYGTCTIHGAIKNVSGWNSCSWEPSGSMCAAPYRSDIVAEWENPRPKLRAWVAETLAGHVFLTDKNMVLEGYVRAPWLDEPEDNKEG